MANLKFISTGSTTVTLSGNGLSNSFTANGSAYTLGTAISLADGLYVLFAGTTSNFSKDSTHYYQFIIGGTGTVTVEGDLISLINNNAYVKQYQFINLFRGCAKITSIANLHFSASIADWCYANMFLGCTGLTNGSITLPAAILANWCYANMFAGCSSLVQAPQISATKSAPYSFYCMFQDCSSLLNAPTITISNMDKSFSCNSMFRNCQSLSSVTVSFNTMTNSNNQTKDWLYNVAPNGTFTKSTALTSYVAGVNGIPNGWTVENYYPSVINTVNQTFSFDAMSNTNQTKEFSYSYNGEETVSIQVDTTNKPSWLSYTTDNNSVDFVANGYAIDSSTTVEIPITFSATDAETKSVTAIFNITNYPAYSITFNTIPNITWDFSEVDVCSTNLNSSVIYTGELELSTWTSELPEGVVYTDGILSASKENVEVFEGTFEGTFNYFAKALDTRTASYNNIGLILAGLADPDLIWYMDFSNGLVEPISKLTGTNNSTTTMVISSDNTMGNYLKCTKSSTGGGISWLGSMAYLNQYISDTNDFSVSFWMRSPSWSSYNENNPLSWKYGDNYNGMVVYKDGGNIKVTFRTGDWKNGSGGNLYDLASDTNGSDSSWVHWVFVRDSNGGKIYRNAVSDGTNSSQVYSNTTASIDLNIGGYYTPWNSGGTRAYFDVTKYRIYKRALTAAEVSNLYDNKK